MSTVAGGWIGATVRLLAVISLQLRLFRVREESGSNPAVSPLMARPLRMHEPHRLYFVTNRTMQGRLLLTPSPRVNDLIGGVLGRAQALHDIELFAFVFVSNHFHLIVRADAGELSRFMQYLQSNIARELGRLVDWRGKFWDRRYSAEPILDEEAFVERLGYVLAHGVKEGLVDRCTEWPGLTCIPEITRGQRRLFSWVSRSLLYTMRQRGRPCSESEATQRYPIELATPPAWAGLSADKRHALFRRIVAGCERHAIQRREAKPSLGRARIQAQHPHDHPQRLSRSPRPLCHASTPALRREYRQCYREFVRAHRQASALFRAGALETSFPRYSYRPPPRYGLDD
ncbi:MAG: transposase [Pseudomonadota bacterium]